MPRLVSRAEFSRIAGVSAPAVTKAAQKQLAAALVSDRIDLDHPAVERYLAVKRTASHQVIERHANLAQLLLDLRRSVAFKVKAAVIGGATREELEALMLDTIASHFKVDEGGV